MNYFDIALAALLTIGFFRGFKRGFIYEVSSLAGLLLGIYGAIFFSDYLSDILKSYVEWDKSVLQLVSFAGTFLIILIVIALLGRLLTKLIEAIALGFFNKLTGAIFGVLKIALILSVILMIFDKMNKSIPFSKEIDMKTSKLYEPIRDLAGTIFPGLVKTAKENFDEETKSKNKD